MRTFARRAPVTGLGSAGARARRNVQAERSADPLLADREVATAHPPLWAKIPRQIPVFPPSANPGQRGHRATVAVSDTEDASEREAERIEGEGSPGARPTATAAPGASHARVEPESIRPALSSPSQALDAGVRRGFESRFAFNFGSIRIHAGPAAAESADAMDANAYTVGRDIVFAAGQYQPHTRSGRQLLVHELTHVMQQTAGVPMVQRDSKKKKAPAQSKMSEEEAEAWFREMNVDDAFADPGYEQDLGESIEELLGRSLTPEEMHRQLLVRRAQPLGASAYQAADPATEMADMKQKIRNAQAKIRAREKKLEGMKRARAAKADVDAVKAEVSSLEREVRTIQTARQRLSRSVKMATPGKGVPAGTGEITYAGIQVETAEGKRIALQFAQTTSTQHAEEEMIEQIEKTLTKEQMAGARVTVVGDQVVCGERCVPALQKFAERNGIESVDGVVFQRTQITPKNFVGPPELASPRTSLRTMTESKSAGRELVRRDLAIYRKSPTPGGSGAAAVGAEVEHTAGVSAERTLAQGAERQVVKGVERTVARSVERTGIAEARAILRSVLRGFVTALRSITPGMVARFGLKFIEEGIKGFVTAKLVDEIIGESRLEDDLAALDAANHAPHDDTPERMRRYEKDAISLLPMPVAVIIAGALKTISPLNPDFLYEATVQEQQRNWEKFKADYGDSDEAAHLYDESLKQADDFFNYGRGPWD